MLQRVVCLAGLTRATLVLVDECSWCKVLVIQVWPSELTAYPVWCLQEPLTVCCLTFNLRCGEPKVQVGVRALVMTVRFGQPVQGVQVKLCGLLISLV